MEANICDVNHLDADVLLPPRKRLLAGFKKESSNGNGAADHPTSASSSPPSPVPSTSSAGSLDTRLNNLLSSGLDNMNLSPEEIFEASRSAATAAVEAAEAARAVAEKKAAIAAKAVAAAKSALDLVASFSEEPVNRDKCQKKNKLKKHVPVQLLYKKHQPIDNNRKDEELARRLHQAMNSSPRISKNSSSSEWKGHKHKKPKSFSGAEKNKVSNGHIILGNSPPSVCNGHAVAGEIDSDDSMPDNSTKSDAEGGRYEKLGQLELVSGDAESSHPRDRACGDTYSPKKRGRVKLKKLPLSICSFRDQVNPKEEMIAKASPATELAVDNATASEPLFSFGSSADGVVTIEAASVWKCQDFKAPACIKHNKVIQS